MDNNIIIRPYYDTDFDQLLKLNLEDQEKWYHGTAEGNLSSQKAKWEELTPYERWLHGGWWLDPDTLKLYLKIIKESDSYVLVAEKNNEIVGECDFSISYDPEFKSIRGHLMWVLTSPKARKKGIGTKLVNTAIDYVKKYKGNQLFTEAEDKRSENLYQKLGFKKKFLIIKKMITDISFLNEDTIFNLENKYSLKEIDFKKIPYQNFIRVIGTFYTPKWDVYRAMHLPELYEILGVPIPNPTAVKIIHNENGIEYYGIIDQNIRLWIPPHEPDFSQVHDVITLLLSEAYFNAHGPDILIQYYSKNSSLLAKLNQQLKNNVETLPLYSKNVIS